LHFVKFVCFERAASCKIARYFNTCLYLAFQQTSIERVRFYRNNIDDKFDGFVLTLLLWNGVLCATLCIYLQLYNSMSNILLLRMWYYILFNAIMVLMSLFCEQIKAWRLIVCLVCKLGIYETGVDDD